jgi:RimJ/RimL family protein N-acetyltransferase
MDPSDNPGGGARLRLDPLTADDAGDLVDVLADPRLYRHTGGEPMNEADLRARFAKLESRRSPDGSHAWLNWTVRLRDGDTAIGYVQATVDQRSVATIAYVIGTAWQGHGLASEAVRAMVAELGAAGIHELRATIPAGHEASARVAAAAGLRKSDSVTPSGEAVWC